MLRKTLEIATPGTKLFVKHGQLLIVRPEQPDASVPIEDIGVLVIDDGRAMYTQQLMIHLLQEGVVVIVTDARHLPLGMMLPLSQHHTVTERHQAQISAGLPLKKRLWQTIVQEKIRQQARVLDFYTGSNAGLFAMARRVRSGDPENMEASAAALYWVHLFGKRFRRERDADGANALLNYGYSILRAGIARALVASGLIPTLGVFHHNRSNPFCLADDLLEPFRPIVDWKVRKMLGDMKKDVPLDDRDNRAALLSLFNETILCGGKRYPLLLAIEAGSASLARALSGGEEILNLPESLPLMQGKELQRSK